MSLPPGYVVNREEFIPNFLFPNALPNIHGRIENGDFGTWSDFPIDRDITITWTCFDKSDVNQEDGRLFRAGFYLRYFLFQISTDESFSDEQTIRPNSLLSAHHTPERQSSYFGVYSNMGDPGRGPLQTYTHIIPAGTLNSHKTYFLRIVPLYMVGHVDDHDDSNTLWNDVDGFPASPFISKFTIETVLNLPVPSTPLTATTNPPTSPPQLGEFGGNVTLTWAFDNATSAFIKPTNLRGFGGVSTTNTAGLNAFITQTTTFTLEVSNENGTVTENITVDVASPRGIIPVFNNTQPFPISTIHDGAFVAKAGDSFDLQLFTEFMQDIHLFVAYPWAKSDSPVTKILVTPPNLIQNLIDGVTQPVTFTIPGPGHTLPHSQAVSGAFGYDAVGKDGNILRAVSGYFILVGIS